MNRLFYPVKRHGESAVLCQNRKENVEYLTFPMLDSVPCIKHLFSTRLGGVSEGIFSSMNVSYTRGDKIEAVNENFKKIAAILEVKKEQFVFSDQTHTTNIRIVTKEDAGKGLTKKCDYSDIDGLVTNEKGLVLSTFYADCVPLYFVDPIKEVIALSHSGWKGTVGKIGELTVNAMVDNFGCKKENILVAIGPSICKDCYEVSADVIEEVEKVIFGMKAFAHGKLICEEEIAREVIKEKKNNKFQLDLWKLNWFILISAGILQEHIQVTDLCTCHNPDYLFSHRASEGRRGNLGAFLMLKD